MSCTPVHSRSKWTAAMYVLSCGSKRRVGRGGGLAGHNSQWMLYHKLRTPKRPSEDQKDQGKRKNDKNKKKELAKPNSVGIRKKIYIYWEKKKKLAVRKKKKSL